LDVTSSRYDMTDVAIFVDVQNVYYTTKHTFSKHFDYNKFWSSVTANRNVVKAIAYAIDRGDPKQREFQNILRAIGFEVKLKPYIQRSDGSAKGDVVVLVSGDGDFDLLAIYVRTEKSKRVEVYGVAALTAKSLISAASEFIPIDQSLLLG